MDRTFKRCGSVSVETMTNYFRWWNIEVIALYVGKVTLICESGISLVGKI